MSRNTPRPCLVDRDSMDCLRSAHGACPEGTPAVAQRWDGIAREATDWNYLRKDPELWFEDGDLVVFLYAQGRSKRGPSFKIPYQWLWSTGSMALCERCVLNSATSSPSSSSSTSSPSNSIFDIAASGHTYELFIPAAKELSRDQAFQFHVTTRNYFAWIAGQPVVGFEPTVCLEDLKVRMDEWREPGADNMDAMFEYVCDQGYSNYRVPTLMPAAEPEAHLYPSQISFAKDSPLKKYSSIARKMLQSRPRGRTTVTPVQTRTPVVAWPHCPAAEADLETCSITRPPPLPVRSNRRAPSVPRDEKLSSLPTPKPIMPLHQDVGRSTAVTPSRQGRTDSKYSQIVIPGYGNGQQQDPFTSPRRAPHPSSQPKIAVPNRSDDLHEEQDLSTLSGFFPLSSDSGKPNFIAHSQSHTRHAAQASISSTDSTSTCPDLSSGPSTPTSRRSSISSYSSTLNTAPSTVRKSEENPALIKLQETESHIDEFLSELRLSEHPLVHVGDGRWEKRQDLEMHAPVPRANGGLDWLVRY